MELEVIKKQANGTAKGTILFVHGVCHGAWCWENYLDFFSGHGYNVVAQSLRGHGGSAGREGIARYTLQDYAADVVQVIEGLDEKPVLVGHSMGGAIAQKIASDAPASIKALVLISSVPASGVASLPETPAMGLSMRIACGEALTAEEVAETSFLDGRLPVDEVRAFADKLQPESMQVLADMAVPFADNYDIGIPVFVLGSTSDGFFPPADQKINADAYGVTPVYLEGACHDMMVDPSWRTSAQAIYGFLSDVL